MACNPANLSPVLYLASQSWLPTMWDYTTSDNVSDVDTYGYFSPAYKQLRAGDIVRVTANDGKGIYFTDGTAFSTPFVGVIKMAVVSSFV